MIIIFIYFLTLWTKIKQNSIMRKKKYFFSAGKLSSDVLALINLEFFFVT